MNTHAVPLPRAPSTHARWPARLDFAQSVSGILLALFLMVHLLLDSAILAGPAAADFVARALEGTYVFGRPYPVLVSLAAGGLMLLLFTHALLALRKFPASYRQWRAFRDHDAGLAHTDTHLWWLQAVTGFLLFFFVAPHLWQMMLAPEAIGAVPSARRVVNDLAVLYYVLFLPVVIVHAALGLYRVAIKWHAGAWATDAARRVRVRRVFAAVAAAYMAIAFVALGTYVVFGMQLP